MASAEFRVLYRIFAYAGTVLVILVIAGYILARVMVPHFFKFSKDIKSVTVEKSLEDLVTARFLEGFEGCENLWVDTASMKILLTDLSGHLYELNGMDRSSLQVTRKLKIADLATGVTFGDSTIYVAACKGNTDYWKSTGGHLYRVDMNLTLATEIAGPFPGINGIYYREGGMVYLTSSNFNPFSPEGRVLAIDPARQDWHQTFIEEAGLANGLYFDKVSKKMLLSNTVEGIFEVDETNRTLHPLYYKTAFMEFTDDICTDRQGNLWMTDPGNSTIKVLMAEDSLLVRFKVTGIGQTSSCRIRQEADGEVLYVTELKRKQAPVSELHDGRGLLSVRLDELYALLDEQQAR
jgi:hypothetical protein